MSCQCSWISKLNLILHLLRKNLQGSSVIFWLFASCLLKGKTFKHMWVKSAIGSARRCLWICTLVREMTSALLKALHHQTTCSKTRPDTLCFAVNCHCTCLRVEYFFIAFQLNVLFLQFWQDLLSVFHYFMQPHSNLKFIVPSHAWNGSAVFSLTTASANTDFYPPGFL